MSPKQRPQTECTNLSKKANLSYLTYNIKRLIYNIGYSIYNMSYFYAFITVYEKTLAADSLDAGGLGGLSEAARRESGEACGRLNI